MTKQQEVRLKFLTNENQQLRGDIARTLVAIDESTVRADREYLKVAKLQGKLRDTKRNIKRLYAEDEESYIEIIIP